MVFIIHDHHINSHESTIQTSHCPAEHFQMLFLQSIQEFIVFPHCHSYSLADNLLALHHIPHVFAVFFRLKKRISDELHISIRKHIEFHRKIERFVIKYIRKESPLLFHACLQPFNSHFIERSSAEISPTTA